MDILQLIQEDPSSNREFLLAREKNRHKTDSVFRDNDRVTNYEDAEASQSMSVRSILLVRATQSVVDYAADPVVASTHNSTY